MNTMNYDYLVIGSGLAGLAFALKAAEDGKVLVLSKATVQSTNTAMAQGGIAAVLSESDSFEQHIQDTLSAGAGLCNETVVRRVVEEAPDRIKDLIDWGVHFDVVDPKGSPVDLRNQALAREGGHSQRRILHVQDHTGASIHESVLKKAQAHPHITILEENVALDLILNHDVENREPGPLKCLGAYCYRPKEGRVVPIFAPVTLLATGGSGKVFLYTTNWSGATGDGVAMAFRAGARVSNLEFTQFHPTCLYHPEARNFLISEAVRGEGGILRNKRGEDFTKKYHAMGSLAPRDIVARAIDAEMKKTGDSCVYLDITHLDAEFIKSRFPIIYERCLAFGIDITKTSIPVVPSAHYQCGGILAGIDGKTDIQNLYALGECASTGLHGANRLASNSLLECLVTAHEALQTILKEKPELGGKKSQLEVAWNTKGEANEDELVLISHLWDEVRRLMWNYVGIVRSNQRLRRAKLRLSQLREEIEEHFRTYKLSSDLIELRNLALVAELVVQCAAERTESRGIHFNLDYPFPTDVFHPPAFDTVISPSYENQRFTQVRE